jgi:hypothetical protein
MFTRIFIPIILFSLNLSAQNPCNNLSSYYFTNQNYQPAGELRLGQGRLYPVWGVSLDAYIPSNRKTWAIAMAHAQHLFRNVSGTDKVPMNFYWATALKESFGGCDRNASPSAGQAFPIYYVAADSADGCFQIESASAYYQMTQLYPNRFPAGQHPNIIGSSHFESAALGKCFYDLFTIKYWEVTKGWNPKQFFNTARDTNAAVKLLAVAYNRGLWYGQLGSVLSSDRTASIADPSLGHYFSDNAFGLDYQEAITNYDLLLSNNANSLPSSLTENNPATNMPFNKFANYYDASIQWADIDTYLTNITNIYSPTEITAARAAARSKFDAIATAGAVSFRYKFGQVLDTIIKTLPADDPSAAVGTVFGCYFNQNNTCGTPTNLQLTNATNNVATLTWAASATGIPRSYTYDWKPSASSIWTTVSTTTTSATLTGLTTCTSYDFRVKTVCNDTSSSNISSLPFQTAGCPVPVCTAPQYVTGNAYGQNAIVYNTNGQYQCIVPGWCSQGIAAYEPGIGWAWNTAWTYLGQCNRVTSAITDPATNNTIGLTAFPNPIENTLSVQLQSNISFGITVFDNLGREVYKANALNGNHQINTSTWSSSTYFIKISLNNTFKTLIVSKI